MESSADGIDRGQVEAGPSGGGDTGFVSFLNEAAARISDRRVLVPAVLLLLILTASNIIILRHLPAAGMLPSWEFLTAAAVRLIALLVLSVAILRMIVPSERPAWRPDGGFFLYSLLIILSFGVVAAAARFGAGREATTQMVINNVATTLLLAPFATWVVGSAVAKPLGLAPGRFMRNFGRWLPQLILWSLLLVSPMAVLHSTLGLKLVQGVGDDFWPIALADGALSTLMALVGLALNAEAYRRVARD